MNFKKKYRKLHRKYLPYSLPTNAPVALQKIWFDMLCKAPNIYKFCFALTYLCYPALFFFYYFLRRKKLPYTRLRVLSVRDKIHPTYYQYFQFSEAEQWSKRYDFLYHRSLQHCLWHLSQRKGTEVLQDKYLFYQFCLAHELPTARNFAYYEQGSVHYLAPKPWEQKHDFIIKARKASKGKGFERFQYVPEWQVYKIASTQNFIRAEMMENYLQKRIAQQDYLLQVCLKNHSQFLAFANDSPAIVRILSLMDTNAQVHLFRPILKLPQAGAVLSHVHKGALAIAIDIETGQLIDTIKWNMQQTPTANSIWKGSHVPFWQKIKKILIQAHTHLAPIALIGWDIALTDEGAVLLEGNLFPNLDIHQKRPFIPFIGSTFCKILLQQLSKESE